MYKYYYINRPFDIGCQPDGYNMIPDTKHPEILVPDKEDYYPAKEYTLPSGYSGSFYGWINYSEPLTFNEIWKYDLMPEDSVTWAHYQFWITASCNEKDARLELDFYMSELRTIKAKIGFVDFEWIDSHRLKLASKILWNQKYGK